GVTSIGGYAFSGCTGLTSIEIPNSVTSIGGYAFDGTPWFETFLDGLIYINNVAYKYRGEMPDNTKIKIKEGTVSISNYAFSGCTGLTSIEIPNSVTSIGYNAFSGCTGLTSIEIPNSVTSIGEVAFSGCTGLTSIEIPSSVTSIGYNAFYGCTGLTSIEIPNSVTSIGDHAFYGCTGLSKVIWNAENCSSVPYSTFNGCSVTEFLFGDDVKVIPKDCCYGMSKLTSVNIPNGVTSIGGYAFSGCTGLTSIEIPNSVTSIGGYAFSGCIGITAIGCNAEIPPTIGSLTFNGVDRSIPLSIPCENAMAYKNAKGWNEFSNLRCIDSGEPAFDPLGPNDRNYYHVVTINANGKRTTYRMSAIQKVTVEDKNVVRKTFKVDFTDKSKSVGDVRVIVSEFADEQEEVVEVETSDTSVTIKWSKVDGANSYKITICKDELCEHVICVLWFDANGNLIVEQPKSGYESGTSKSTKSLSYTVTGLTPGTMYNYSVQVFDTSNQLMIEETGEFSTEMSTAVDAANGSVQVYSVGKSIVVNSPTPCNIMFYDSVGRGLGECVVASHCRCTVTLPGVYIVIAGDKQYKIRVN
ncbi:MAG: fibronectin type III domain-containing protein, partial [Bacteroidales bacterium]|nr:fibronectin type III domain-containing protein [Bacteroidales bacterium]